VKIALDFLAYASYRTLFLAFPHSLVYNMQLGLGGSFFITSLTSKLAVAQKSSGSASRYIREASDYMLSHYKERISLDILAERLSLNKYYLQKLYRQHTGHTPYEYLVNIRINHAKEMLRTSVKSISLVAEESGIENVSHFIKLFKKSEGITPMHIEGAGK
jgi:YesN/AraC family two-component response regulator